MYMHAPNTDHWPIAGYYNTVYTAVLNSNNLRLHSCKCVHVALLHAYINLFPLIQYRVANFVKHINAACNYTQSYLSHLM